jgi:serine/threonine-protein kinase RsbW
MENIKLEIPSLPENIRIVESFIDNAKEKYKIRDDLYGNIMISVTEAVSNAIIHGNKSDAKKMVKLEMIFMKDKIQFLIEDNGEGFDYENLPDPTAPENLTKSGGRGIFIMKNLCDSVEFLDKGKKVLLTFTVLSK